MIVHAGGADIFYSTRGQGPVCLVLSAIGTKPYELQTPPPLGDHLALVYVDLRGAGQSTGDAADLTFDVVAEDLEAVRADLGVERVTVLGHSILGMLALEYGRRRPASVSHVIVVGTPPRGDMFDLSAKAAAFFEANASEDRKRVLRENMTSLPAGASPGQALFAQTPMRFFDPRFDAAPLFAGAEVRPGVLQHVMGTLASAWDVTADAASLRVPIFIGHGRYDYTVPFVLWRAPVEALPDATLHVFERSGHQPFFEEPEAFTAAVTGWMGARS